MINQNEVAAKLMTGLGYKKWVVIHDTTDYGKGHNEYFTKYVKAERRADRRHLRRHRRPAGFHRRAHAGKGAQSRGDLLRRPHADRRPHPVADGQARHQRGAARAPRASSPTPISRRWDRWRRARSASSRAPRSRSCRAGSFSRSNTTRPEYKEPPEAYGAFAFAAMQLILDTIEKVGPDRKKVTDALGKIANYDFIIGQGHVRRSRAEHRAADHQIRRAGRQVGDLGGQRVRSRQAQAARAQNVAVSGVTGRRACARPRVALPLDMLPRHDGVELARSNTINGLMLGMMYALVAVGFTLFFGVLDVIKFSHGDVLTVGVFTGFATYVGVEGGAGQLSTGCSSSSSRRGDGGDGAARRADRPLSRAAAALGAGAQHAADHADAGNGAARRRAAGLYPHGANPKPFPALLPTTADRPSAISRCGWTA